ncbi:heavy metal translocating P-type ATPase [Litoreibacter janthinus]|uniref:Cu2+-exporting ATPase n=1 Tax=Litoreibacter janthinus TaxID=670154 RepID=A0A1I6FQP2_9RHOB|nr:heavy metal translocating P-type ATPase [Litoreibacter janthinus]SFR32208.1 Cu2+-exporting ATPase [Litoreibacter janthinus]
MSVMSCPGCAGAPLAEETARSSPASSAGDTVSLSLPGIHCAACVSGVERGLARLPEVLDARVNLSLKRVTVQTRGDADEDGLINALLGLGFEALPLDSDTLRASEGDPAGRALLLRLAVAGFAMMNVMILSVAVWAGAAEATRQLFHWISAIIALPAVAFAARPFFVSALSVLRVGRVNMEVPISLAILLASGLSLYETMAGGEDAYFDAALSLTFFLLIGRYLDHRTRAAARSAAQELAALEVPSATCIRDGKPVRVKAADIVVGDLVQVPAGGRVPVDGIVDTGRSQMDRSLLTGESLPVAAQIGSSVVSGEVNLSNPLVIRATAVGQDTTLRRMAEMVAVAESGRSHYTPLADRAAQLYAPLVHGLAALAFVGWFIATGDARYALNIAIATLIITCPCALGLAVPAVTTAASGSLFRKGLLIKSATALERLAEVDTVVFDKTGTLTDGTPILEDLQSLSDQDRAAVLALSQSSDHPVSRLLASALAGLQIEPADLTDIHEIAGRGVEGRDGAEIVRLGKSASASGGTVFQRGAGPEQALRIDETLREGAHELVANLRSQGMDLELLSGDTDFAAAKLGARLGLVQSRGGMLPADKIDHLAALQDQRKHVLMVGDGLNDMGAMAQAFVSISPASGVDATRATSDIVLLGRSLAPVQDALRVARRARARIRENFGIAICYNAVAVPLAISGFASPLMAALAMSSSSILVILNALRVRA